MSHYHGNPASDAEEMETYLSNTIVLLSNKESQCVISFSTLRQQSQSKTQFSRNLFAAVTPQTYRIGCDNPKKYNKMRQSKQQKLFGKTLPLDHTINNNSYTVMRLHNSNKHKLESHGLNV